MLRGIRGRYFMGARGDPRTRAGVLAAAHGQDAGALPGGVFRAGRLDCAGSGGRGRCAGLFEHDRAQQAAGYPAGPGSVRIWLPGSTGTCRAACRPDRNGPPVQGALAWCCDGPRAARAYLGHCRSCGVSRSGITVAWTVLSRSPRSLCRPVPRRPAGAPEAPYTPEPPFIANLLLKKNVPVLLKSESVENRI